MFSPLAIGHVTTPYKNTHEIPKGFGAKHDAEGTIEIAPEFEAGLTDIEGFSHLFVIWVFDRSEGYELLGTPPLMTGRMECLRRGRRDARTRLD
jgi:tRNA (adenine37-N6)-methyltransferase